MPNPRLSQTQLTRTLKTSHNEKIERVVVAFVFAAVADISGEELTCIRQEKAQYGSVRPDS